MPDVYAVSELNTHIRQIIEADTTLGDLWIQGEVSNMKRAASGHWYFSLKDDRAQMRCVMWRSSASRQFVVPQDGDNIVVHGYVSLYDQRGDVQFYADFVRAAGVGDLYAQFEQLKAKLDAEGLFALEHKKPLPTFPLRIGVVTSADAAALQDVLNVLSRRFALAEVILSPTLVQGVEAPSQIVEALTRLDSSQQVDVILLVRGGGSMEDLWAFNDEQVAKAIFGAITPIVSGVGHETDFTIVDFVADHRAPTPSAAAEVVTPDISNLRHVNEELQNRLDIAVGLHIANRRDKIQEMARTLNYLSPAADIRNHRQRVDEIHTRLVSNQNRQLVLLRERLEAKATALHVASPQAILERGYAIVRRADDGKIISQFKDAVPDSFIRVRVADGEFNAQIEKNT